MKEENYCISEYILSQLEYLGTPESDGWVKKVRANKLSEHDNQEHANFICDFCGKEIQGTHNPNYGNHNHLEMDYRHDTYCGDRHVGDEHFTMLISGIQVQVHKGLTEDWEHKDACVHCLKEIFTQASDEEKKV
jgi:hypothetical protein